MEHAQSDDDESDDEEDSEEGVLIKKLDGSEVKGDNSLSKRAALFFDQDIFAGINEGEGEDEAENDEAEVSFTGFDNDDEEEEGDVEMEDVEAVEQDEEEEGEEEDGIEFVKTPKEENWDADDEPMKNGRPGKSR